MSVIDMVNGKLCETLPIEEIEQIRNESYNQALEDMRKGIKEILEDNAIYNIDCIDTLIKQLTK